jgi:hypothetical protein
VRAAKGRPSGQREERAGKWKREQVREGSRSEKEGEVMKERGSLKIQGISRCLINKRKMPSDCFSCNTNILILKLHR